MNAARKGTATRALEPDHERRPLDSLAEVPLPAGFFELLPFLLAVFVPAAALPARPIAARGMAFPASTTSPSDLPALALFLLLAFGPMAASAQLHLGGLTALEALSLVVGAIRDPIEPGALPQPAGGLFGVVTFYPPRPARVCGKARRALRVGALPARGHAAR